jgi:signal transduction histidine kinase/ActR/RegA family two-component response regulator
MNIATNAPQAGGGSISLDARLARERRARLQAERLLALRSEELYSANRKLAEHAQALSSQVIEQREENAALKGMTSQVAAELEMATDRAARAEQRLWDALTAVEDGFAIFDRDCRLVVANPAFLNHFDGIGDIAPGASYDAILRVAVDEGLVDLEGAHPDDWVEQMLKRWERENIPQIDIRLWNGAYVRLIDKRTPRGDMVCLGVDITSTVRRERQLQRARDAALAASHAKSTFLANMSHEIRTPMNGVVAMAETLAETALDADQKLYADTIRHSGEALLVIINDILDYSKAEAGKLTLHEEAFDLAQVILEVFGLLRPGLEGRDIGLLLDLDVPFPNHVLGDAGRVRQILLNLLGNAVKFTEAGHVRLAVRPGEAEGGAALPLVFTVEDTGIGIAPELQAHVFGEFNQAQETRSRSHDGTGLGLAITKRLVEMMDGRISLTSAPGVGSTFEVALPLDRPPVQDGMPAPQISGACTREVLLIGLVFSERAHDLIDRLAGLGCRIRAVPDPGHVDMPTAGTPLILLADVTSAGMDAISGMRAGGAGPVFCLPASEEDAPDGVTRLDWPGDRGDLARLLWPETDSAAGPEPTGEAVVEMPAVSGPETPAAPEPPTERSGRLRLLAAEDNKTNRLVFQSMVKSLDIDLTMVENGNALVAAYKDAPPDLVFSDISMPGMDGLEAVSLIRAHETAHGLDRVPIVAMTAHALSGDKERFLEAGFDDYLTKPLKKPRLLDRISRHAPKGRDPVV